MNDRTRHSVAILIVTLVIAGAQGQTNTWTVREYGGPGGSDCGCYATSVDNKTILLTENPGIGRELKFEVYWADANGDYVSEAPLNNFTIHGDVDQALIEISIFGDPDAEDSEHPYGASDIARMNIAPGNFGECRLKALKISGDLAVGGDVTLDDVTGSIYIERGLSIVTSSPYSEETYALIVEGNVDGDIEIGEMYGAIPPADPNNGQGILVENGYVNGDITIHNVVSGTGYRATGRILIGDDYYGTINVQDTFTGHIDIKGRLYGNIDFDYALMGHIELGGTLESPAGISVGGFTIQPNEGWGSSIHVKGDVIGGEADIPILVGNDLRGIVAIDGSIYNRAVHARVIEIEGGVFGAVAVDWDGYHEGDEWPTGATVTTGTAAIPVKTFTGNTPEAHVWEITGCIGDMNNNGYLDSGDLVAHEYNWGYPTQPYYYRQKFPGLFGSRDYHGNLDHDQDIDEDDYNLLALLVAPCMADLDGDGDVDLSDLAILLANYNMASGAEHEDGDIDGDGDVDLSDLAALLAVYGETCTCPRGSASSFRESGERGLLTTYVDLSVMPVDTGGYTGGGFVGEVDHFVFDLQIEVDDPNNDDWIVTGAALDASNDAEFRLAAASSYPDQYATFVAAPWTSLPGSPTAGVAGAFDPVDPDETFATDEINIGWYDTSANSHDGPATVMRIVIDVSDVTGADVSGGFGAVYFGKAKRDVDDILVAELSAGAGTKLSQGGLATFGGSFFVTGE